MKLCIGCHQTMDPEGKTGPLPSPTHELCVGCVDELVRLRATSWKPWAQSLSRYERR